MFVGSGNIADEWVDAIDCAVVVVVGMLVLLMLLVSMDLVGGELKVAG